LTVPQLKAQLRELNLEVTGTKAQLKQRLDEHLNKKSTDQLTKDELFEEIKKNIPADVFIPVKTKKNILEEIYTKIIREDLDKWTKQQLSEKLKEKNAAVQKDCSKQNLIDNFKRQIIQQALNINKKDSPIIQSDLIRNSESEKKITEKAPKSNENKALVENSSGNMTAEQLRKHLEEKGVKFARKKETKEVYSQLYNTLVLNNDGQTNDQIRELLKHENVTDMPVKATKKELIERLKTVLLLKVEK
jgi:hypothetical protein